MSAAADLSDGAAADGAVVRRPHEPAMAREVVEALGAAAGGRFLDGTFGAGGHSRAILESSPSAAVLALDRDGSCAPAAEVLRAEFPGRFRFAAARFSRLEEEAGRHSLLPLDGVALDLGVSSMQLDDPARGFSHSLDGPLRMTMDCAAPLDPAVDAPFEGGAAGAPSAGGAAGGAAALVARLSEDELEELLRIEGDEPRARRVARDIARARALGPVDTTARLAEAVAPAAAGRGPEARRRLARVFQALRRSVNREAEELEAALAAAARALRAGGRCVVLSFHSLEDRAVKRAFAAGEGRPFRPLAPALRRPGEAERARNPRARPARMRAAERVGGLAPAGEGAA